MFDLNYNYIKIRVEHIIFSIKTYYMHMKQILFLKHLREMGHIWNLQVNRMSIQKVLKQ